MCKCVTHSFMSTANDSFTFNVILLQMYHFALLCFANVFLTFYFKLIIIMKFYRC